MQKKIFKINLLWLILIIIGCNAPTAADTPAEAVVRTPVTVTGVSHQSLSEYIDLPATSSYLLKNIIKANANGYLHSATRKLGQYIGKGEVLFTLKTKEAENLGNVISVLDSSFRFTGINNIQATQGGILTQIDHQSGDYVQDGEQLAVITDLESFAFVMNVPYEQLPQIKGKNTVEIIMPDGEKFSGSVGTEIPLMDSATQTERILIRVKSNKRIPENIIAKVHILKVYKNNAVSVPKEAVLTDETQSQFWIMKMMDSTTAVKVPVEKGTETSTSVEIISPVLDSSDMIVISGNYGLPDTANVTITNIPGK
jgi:multidrug efflux pump subunit AcrA (membrane-fusion protein)